MSKLRDKAISILNKLNLDAGKNKLGDLVMKQGVPVAYAAGAAPTKAEFDALVQSLRDAELIKV